MPKQPLLLLHGALGSQAQFMPLLPFLEEFFELHTLDFSAHGNVSLSNKKFGIEQFATDVNQYLRENNLAKVSIFGYSMGGYVALWLSSKYPEKIDRIFTLGTKIFWTPEYASTETTRLDPEVMQQKIPQFTQTLNTRHTATPWQELVLHTKQMMEDLGQKNLLTPDVLKEIQHFVRLSIGDKDNTLTFEEYISAYRLLPNAQLQVFPNTPHPLEKIKLELLAVSIRQFFE